MSYKTFRMWQAIIGAIMGGVMGASIGMGNWVVPIITIAVAVVVIMILRRRVKDIVADERTHVVAEKAARLTLITVIYGMAVIGVIFIAVSHDKSSILTQIGLAFEYAVCVLLIISSLAYTYYNRKLGGK